MIMPEQTVNSEARAKFLSEWEAKIDLELAIHGEMEISVEDHYKIKDLLKKYKENGFEVYELHNWHGGPHGGFYTSVRNYLLRVKKEVKEVKTEPVKTTDVSIYTVLSVFLFCLCLCVTAYFWR